MADENKPLINAAKTEDYGSRNASQNDFSERDGPPPPYDSAIHEPQRYNLFGGVSSQTDFRNTLYETYTPVTGQFITCRVCQSEIDITGKRDQFVVKCLFCNEATPIQKAPPGKKYVRCPCHCLLVCKISSQRIACPRPNCKRIINLGTSPITPPVSSSNAGMDFQQVSCAHCNEIFLFKTLSNKLARCPHCKKVSSIGREYARIRGYFYLIMGIILLSLSTFITLGTYNNIGSSWIYYVVYAGMYLVTCWAFWQSQYYFCVKVSSISESPTDP